MTWRARCYGVTDVPLARAAFALPEPPPVERVVHSGLRRTRGPAEKLAAALGVPRIEDAQWRERDFGTWEGQTWHAIYRATGDAMDGMLTDPEGFRPGGDGETTMELAWRVVGRRARSPARPWSSPTAGRLRRCSACATACLSPNGRSTCRPMAPWSQCDAAPRSGRKGKGRPAYACPV
ncbi:histidine phosphatase family protein [Hankyongella ginsenosidimutans]|uniref:histidine phosphatase family protein n=1 Tax=Hankyongella ginsenosidimutans TaxID=1763828 RepID=UPI001CA34F7A|nr:histidine phosphatase family protein [Hankyongella ginsenosidimutans]